MHSAFFFVTNNFYAYLIELNLREICTIFGRGDGLYKMTFCKWCPSAKRNLQWCLNDYVLHPLFGVAVFIRFNIATSLVWKDAFQACWSPFFYQIIFLQQPCMICSQPMLFLGDFCHLVVGSYQELKTKMNCWDVTVPL